MQLLVMCCGSRQRHCEAAQHNGSKISSRGYLSSPCMVLCQPPRFWYTSILYHIAYIISRPCIPHVTMVMMQGDRHSIAYFANCTGSTVLQGPQKKYPPVTFPEILAEKRRQVGDVNRDEMTDEEKMAFDLNNALGPEMQPVDMTHSGKPEFEVVESCESGKPKIQPMVKGKLSPDLEHLRLQPSVSVI